MPIAIYHCSIKVFSRGKGKSAVAAAAYRSGTLITSEYDGRVNDYTHKGGITHTEILLPENAPPEYSDRAVLWNAVEMSERYKNAQLAREIEISLPAELSIEQNIALARRFVKENFVSAGMCADVCVHDKDDGNPHAHIMLTMRPIEKDGTWGQKSRTVNGQKIPTVDWNEQTKAEEWRRAWAAYCNTALRINGFDTVVDNRSYERQGIEQVPTIHMGAAASQMEKRGIRTERGDINREIEVTNQKLRQLRARIVDLQKWVKEEVANTEPPTLADVIQGILDRRKQDGTTDRYQSTSNLKAAAAMLNFLQSNKIMDMAGLEEKMKSMFGRQSEIRDKLKPIERRIPVLDEHIKQADIYLKYRPIYQQYQQEQKPKKKEAFAEEHRREITLYEGANGYLKRVMNGHTALPTRAWKAERDKLTTEKTALNREYVSLKSEVAEVDKIRHSVYDIMREEARQQQPTKTKRAEL